MCGGGGSSQTAAQTVEIPEAVAGPTVITSEIVEGPDRIEPAGSSNNNTSISTSSNTGLNIPGN